MITEYSHFYLPTQKVSSLKTQWGIVRNNGSLTSNLGSHHCPCSLWTGSSWKGLIAAGRVKKELAYNEVADGVIRYRLGCPFVSLPSSFFYPFSSRFFFLLLFETSWYKIRDTFWLLIGASTNVCAEEAISGCLSRLFKLSYHFSAFGTLQASWARHASHGLSLLGKRDCVTSQYNIFVLVMTKRDYTCLNIEFVFLFFLFNLQLQCKRQDDTSSCGRS